MEKTWRWFGKKDKITLPMLRQIGVEGIVTALHEVPNGEIWTVEAINDLKSYIESYGLRWSVVESLPVCEAIKYAGTEREQLIENYKVSLANLGKCGVKTVCYNFMPVIDWIRTDLQYPWPDGTSSLYYDRIRFAYFDIKILEREGAEKDYTEEELHKVAELDKVITETEKDDLIDTIIVKTQGFVNGNIKEGDKNPVAIFKRLLGLYKDIDRDALRENMCYFLSAIMPVCDEYGINMCVHPDDPPFQRLSEILKPVPQHVGGKKIRSVPDAFYKPGSFFRKRTDPPYPPEAVSGNDPGSFSCSVMPDQGIPFAEFPDCLLYHRTAQAVPEPEKHGNFRKNPGRSENHF